MDYNQSLAIWFAMRSVTASSKERRAAGQVNPFQAEEEFIPFHLPPIKPQPSEEAQSPVAETRSEALADAA